MLAKTEIQWSEPACCMGPDGCVCGDMERALRGWIGGYAERPMTDAERQACLDEIGQVEGWKAEDHINDSDADLARSVLSVWTEYCRDKGLL